MKVELTAYAFVMATFIASARMVGVSGVGWKPSRALENDGERLVGTFLNDSTIRLQRQ